MKLPIFHFSDDFKLTNTGFAEYKSPKEFFSILNKKLNSQIRNTTKALLNTSKEIDVINVRMRYINVIWNIYVSEINLSVKTKQFFDEVMSSFHHKAKLLSLTMFKPHKFYKSYNEKNIKVLNRFVHAKEDMYLDKLLVIKTFVPKIKEFVRASSVIANGEVFLNAVQFSYLLEKYSVGIERNGVHKMLSVEDIQEHAKTKVKYTNDREGFSHYKTILVPLTMLNKLYEDIKILDIDVQYEKIPII